MGWQPIPNRMEIQKKYARAFLTKWGMKNRLGF
jgi:hypothetical protein